MWEKYSGDSSVHRFPAPHAGASAGAARSETRRREKARRSPKKRWSVKKSAAEVRPIREKAKAMLARAGLPSEAIERDCPVWVNREELVTDTLHEARDRD